MMESEQDKEARKTEFAVFGIENLAERLRMSGRDIVAELNKTNGIEHFLYPSYEALHTQGKEYIVDELLTYIRRHNPNFGKEGGL